LLAKHTTNKKKTHQLMKL